MYGIKDEILERIKEVFKSISDIETVILYGSRAKGNYRPGSDIDITLKGKNVGYETLLELSMRLDDLLLPYIFDISIYDQIENQDLIDHIERVGKVFYKRLRRSR